MTGFYCKIDRETGKQVAREKKKCPMRDLNKKFVWVQELIADHKPQIDEGSQNLEPTTWLDPWPFQENTVLWKGWRVCKKQEAVASFADAVAVLVALVENKAVSKDKLQRMKRLVEDQK